jgi:hypothetical protein
MKTSYRSILSRFAVSAMVIGIIACGVAGPLQAQSVQGFFIGTDQAYPVSVVVSAPVGTTGRVTSSQTGCKDSTLPCPKEKQVKISCPYSPGATDVCSAFFKGGTKVTLKANPGNSVFAGWNYVSETFGGNYNIRLEKSFSLLAYSTAVTAYFAAHGTMYDLIVSPPSGPGNLAGVKIISHPEGIECHGDGSGVCSYPFPAGIYVTLTAQTGSLAQPWGWNLNPYLTDLCNMPGPCKVPMTPLLWH